MQNNLAFIRSTLYAMKRAYGLPVNIVWRTESTPNLETGKKTVVKSSIFVRRGIVLPSNIDKDFVYDLSFIASNKNFTYGGLYNRNQRRLIFDRADLPTDFKIEVGYYFIFDGNRYEAEDVQEAELRAGYLVLAKQIANIDLEDLIIRQTVSTLHLNHEVTLA